MALLVCPDCGGNVSSKAAKCPRCGCPVSVMVQEITKQAPEPQNEVPVQNTVPESPTIEQKQAVEPEPQNIETTQTIEPKPTTIEYKQKTETTNDNAKWGQGALIGGALIAVIVIIVTVFFSKKSSDYAQYKSNDETITVNGVSFKMIKVDGGSFNMGSNDSDAYDDEKPVHRVTLNDFYIGETEVTQGLWKAVMGNNPSYFSNGDNFPVEGVSWNECQQFIQMLNAKTGKNFSLPTEAQWEYAALGGRKSLGYKYSGSNSISIVGWYDSNCNDATHYVKALSDNELGLYDMTGNVYEWCQDWYADRYDSNNSLTDPIGPNYGTLRVVRSGSWKSKSRNCRVAYRFKYAPDYKFRNLGLRLCINTNPSHNYTEATNSEIQNSAEATRKLNDFKRKITSYPFEEDAIKCLKTIDNEYTKCALFLGNITTIAGVEYDQTLGYIFCYNAVLDRLYKYENGKFNFFSPNNLSKKNIIIDEIEYFNQNAGKESPSDTYSSFSVIDYSNKGLCFINPNSSLMGDPTEITAKISLSDMTTEVLKGEIIQDKYLVEFEGVVDWAIDPRKIKKVKDLLTNKEINNPFIKPGAISFTDYRNTQIDLVVHNDASVTGTVVCHGEKYTITEGNQTIKGEINLLVPKTGYHTYYFIIERKGSSYKLKKVLLVAEYYEEEYSMEVFKK